MQFVLAGMRFYGCIFFYGSERRGTDVAQTVADARTARRDEQKAEFAKEFAAACFITSRVRFHCARLSSGNALRDAAYDVRHRPPQQ